MNQETISEDEQAYLGITGTTVTESYAQQLNIPAGIYVQTVEADSPAESGGLYAGDIITKFDGSTVSTMEELYNKLENTKAGTEVTITISRRTQRGEYQEQDLQITLGSKKDK
jgi:serine protease Do